MNVKSKNTPNTWVDPDDAPELDDEFFNNGTHIVKGKPVSAEEGKAAMRKARGRPAVANKKRVTTIRLDPDTLERWQATGKGWQTRASALLSKYAP